MKKIRLVAFLIGIAVMTAGCSASSPSALSWERFLQDSVTTDENYIYYKEVVSLADAYPGYSFEPVTIDSPDGLRYFPVALDSKGTIYLKPVLEGRMKQDSIGIYDPVTSSFVPLISSDGSEQTVFGQLIEDRYIVWSKLTSVGDNVLGLYLYDTETAKNIDLFPTRYHTQTGKTILQADFDSFVYRDGCLYFSVTGQTQDEKRGVYRYQVGDEVPVRVSGQRGALFSYGGEVACLNLASPTTGNKLITCQLKSLSGVVLETMSGMGSLAVRAKDDLLVLSTFVSTSEMISLKEWHSIEAAAEKQAVHANASAADSAVGQRIAVRKKGVEEPLLVSLTYGDFSQSITDGRFILPVNARKPILYDAKTDKIIDPGFSPGRYGSWWGKTTSS